MSTNAFDPTNQTTTDPSQQQPANNQNQNFGGPVSVSGSTAANQSANPQQQSTAQNSPTSSGRFQNLNAYLKANSGYNADNGGLAGQVNQQFQSTGNLINQNIQNAQSNFGTQAEQNRVQNNPDYVNNALKDPAAFVQNQDNVNQFGNYLNAQYKGPQNFDPSGTLQNNVLGYNQMAGQTGTEQGRFDLLRQMFNTPSYTSGQQSLDNLLLQSNPQQLQALQSSKQLANSMGQNVNDYLNKDASIAGQYSDEANATRAATLAALNNTITGFDTNQANAVAQATQNRDKAFQNEQGVLNIGSTNQPINSQDALNFGLISKLGQAQSSPLYNLNLANYLTESTDPATKQNVSSAADYAKIAALGQLAGNTATGDISKILSSYGDPSQAGTFNTTNPYSFNTAQFQKDQSGAQDSYNTAISPYQQAYGQAQTALNTGDPSANFQGGLLGEEQRRADSINSAAQQIYNNATQNTMATPDQIAQIMALQGYKGYTPGMSEQQLVQNYATPGNVATGTDPGSNAWLLQTIASQQQKQTNAQQQLNQLASQMGANRFMNISDASQYAPVSVKTPGSTDTSATDPTMAALNNIANRV